MENGENPERNVLIAEKLWHLGQRACAWAARQDLSPHEGRLRSSVMPVEFMEIPDHPPVHDDTLPPSDQA